MRYMGSLLLLIILSASIAGCAAERDRIIYQDYAGHNYCHTKVETAGHPLTSRQPNVVDYYGPCDAFD
jgi:hypothetical protein